MNQERRKTIEKLISDFELDKESIKCLTGEESDLLSEEVVSELKETLSNIEETIDCLRRMTEPRRKQP
jgi:hypothetical protein